MKVPQRARHRYVLGGVTKKKIKAKRERMTQIIFEACNVSDKYMVIQEYLMKVLSDMEYSFLTPLANARWCTTPR